MKFYALITANKVWLVALEVLLLLNSCKTPQLEIYDRHHRPGLYVDLQLGFKDNQTFQKGNDTNITPAKLAKLNGEKIFMNGISAVTIQLCQGRR